MNAFTIKDVKVVLPGGSGYLGRTLTRAFERDGHEVVVLSRSLSPHARHVAWDGRTLGAWANELDGADAVINLAGRSVNCRYTKTNLAEMLASRVDSTRAVGRAIDKARRPPRVWLQMSTATIYAHGFDEANDEQNGRIGGNEPGAPKYWRLSVEIARAWEQALAAAGTPHTRKVALRATMVMGTEPGGVFDVLRTLARLGLGGPLAGGEQFVSWIHESDFVRAVAFLIERDDISGPVNVAAPVPLPQSAFMRYLRGALGVPLGMSATRWMAELGALALGTDTELVLKSRRVVPRRLLEAGFSFDFPTWPAAAADLVARGTCAEVEGVYTRHAVALALGLRSAGGAPGLFAKSSPANQRQSGSTNAFDGD